MAITESASTTGVKCCVAQGAIGRENRRKPYVPIFRSTLASRTLPAVGASTCAAGNQVWKGNIGTLMANEIKKARKIQYWNWWGNEAPWLIISGMLKLPTRRNRAMIATSRNTEPAIV